jgi:hypothetical protein
MKVEHAQVDSNHEPHDDDFAKVWREIIRAVKSVNYGSVEIVIQNARIVQIERKEKFRLDRS